MTYNTFVCPGLLSFELIGLCTLFFFVCLFLSFCLHSFPSVSIRFFLPSFIFAVGTADAEISVPFVVNPGLTNVLLLKPGVGQNIATHDFCLGLSGPFIFIFPNPLPTLELS